MFCPARHRVGVQLYAQRKIRSFTLRGRTIVTWCLPPTAIGEITTPPIIAGTTGTQMSIFEPGPDPAILPSWPGRNAQPETFTRRRLPADWWWERPETRSPWGQQRLRNPVTGVTSIVPFQRAFAVEAQNVASQPIFVRFTIANQPTGGSASFPAILAV